MSKAFDFGWEGVWSNCSTNIDSSSIIEKPDNDGNDNTERDHDDILEDMITIHGSKSVLLMR